MSSAAATLYTMLNVSVASMPSILTKEELVARYVREAIVAGRLSPGERIRQQALATELGMSPTPVREALRGLVTEGWLALVPHVGVSVAEVNQDGVDEVYRLREMLESRLAADAARRMTRAQIAQIREINDAYKRASRDNNSGLARETNFHFHAYIWEAAGWPQTVAILHALWVKAPWAAMSGVRGRERRTIKEHNSIVAALASGDSAKAQESLAVHIRSGRSDYHKAIHGEPVDED
jgi:DNA-binding GntR family transcriptional regulator